MLPLFSISLSTNVCVKISMVDQYIFICNYRTHFMKACGWFSTLLILVVGSSPIENNTVGLIKPIEIQWAELVNLKLTSQLEFYPIIGILVGSLFSSAWHWRVFWSLVWLIISALGGSCFGSGSMLWVMAEVLRFGVFSEGAETTLGLTLDIHLPWHGPEVSSTSGLEFLECLLFPLQRANSYFNDLALPLLGNVDHVGPKLEV